MSVLAEAPVTVTASVADLSNAGPAIAMWAITKHGDRKAGSAAMLSFDSDEIVASAAALITWLLRQGGHHHHDAHDEVRAGTLPPGVQPFSLPRYGHPCPPIPGSEDICACDVTAAAHVLNRILVNARLVADPLTQLLNQFEVDVFRQSVVLTNVNVIQVVALTEAAATLAARRWRTDTSTVLDRARAEMTENLAGRTRPPRCAQAS